MKTADVIVVGGGGMGSATAFHLARRGRRVILLERFGVAHERGSSHGLTRIIRLAYWEHPKYVPLLRRAYELWEELEAESGRSLLHITGGLDVGAPRSPGFLGALESCRVHGLEHSVLDAAELQRRFPALRVPEDFRAVLQPRGGYLEPEACIAAHVELARRHGCDVRLGETVSGWQAGDGGVEVTTDRGAYAAERLVLAAGAWTPKLLPRPLPLAPERQVVAWFEPRDPDLFAPGRFPVFILGTRAGHMYGFPVAAGDPGFKVGLMHHLHQPCDPDDVDREVHDADVELLRSLVEEHFPAASALVKRASTCMFTNTPDEHFILDLLPGEPNVVLVSCCSGHGFKFAATVGEVAADLAESGRTAHDIGLFAATRFDRAS